MGSPRTRQSFCIFILLVLGFMSMYIYTTQFHIQALDQSPQNVLQTLLSLRKQDITTANPNLTASRKTVTNMSAVPKTIKPTIPSSTAAATDTIIRMTTTSTATAIPTTTAQTSTKLTPTTILSTTPGRTTAGPVYSCSFPILDPFDPAIKKFINITPPLTCNGIPSVAYVDKNMLRIDQQKIKDKVGDINFCQYSPLKLSQQNDIHLEDLKWSPRFYDSIVLPDDLEHFYVQCLKDGKVVAETYKSRVFKKPEVEKRSMKRYADHIKKFNPAETMSVMFVGVDGMSKQNLIRTMPKTRNFILKTMNARELNMFNKVGDNTFRNVLVLLTGRTYSDFEKIPDWDMKKNYFDSVDNMFVWNAYQSAGYRTASIFDVIRGTAFHYLKRGWKNPPFDYYHRPGPLMMDKRYKVINCVGDQREVSLLLDYYLELTAQFNNTKNSPYFAYSFFTKLTHDYQNKASEGDEMFLEFFTKLHASNVLNNTILIFFSDHGPRFGPMRKTFNGFVEGRSPYFFVMFPPWFEEKYKEEMSIFQRNQNRLTTFFDIHATLYDILHFKGKKAKDSDKLRGTSLFQEIPSSRTCEEAHIPTEYCLCKDMSKRTISDDTKTDLASLLVNMINERTENNRNICAKLALKSIRSVMNFNSEEKTQEYYQITLQTTPGDADFEALLAVHEESQSAKLIGDIVRLNFYKGQDGCVNTLDLKPYCYCMV